MNLGNHVESVLSSLGVTPELVERWVGSPCGCPERKEKLNQLGQWAGRVIKGKISDPVGRLLIIIKGE